MKKQIQEVLEALEIIRDEKHEAFVKKMIPSAKTVYGIRAKQLKEIIKDLKKACNDYSASEKIALAIELVKTNHFEAGQIAYEFIGKNQQLLEALTLSEVHQMNHGLDNWASVDAFGVYVHGKAWRMGIIPDEEILQLSQHPNFWQRRLAVVSTIPLNQKANGGTGDSQRTLMICDQVKGDYVDLVVKAVSWALRELSKREPELISDYLATNATILHRRVIREVSNKLETGLKTPK